MTAKYQPTPCTGYRTPGGAMFVTYPEAARATLHEVLAPIIGKATMTYGGSANELARGLIDNRKAVIAALEAIVP